MNAVTLEKEQALRSQIDEAQGELGKLEQDLAVVEGELQGLMTERERYESLAHVCDSLDKLSAVGAAELFWGDGGPAEDRIRLARQRIEDFHERVKAVSESRQVVASRLAEGRGVLAILEDDWFELQEEEEERRNEWVIEREVGPTADRPPTMPWTRGGADDERFRKSLGSALLAALLLGVLFPLVPLPVPQPTDIIEVPERLVELIRQEGRRAGTEGHLEAGRQAARPGVAAGGSAAAEGPRERHSGVQRELREARERSTGGAARLRCAHQQHG
jgi:hypothetical protein